MHCFVNVSSSRSGFALRSFSPSSGTAGFAKDSHRATTGTPFAFSGCNVAFIAPQSECPQTMMCLTASTWMAYSILADTPTARRE